MTLLAAETSPDPEAFRTSGSSMPRWWPWVWAVLACLMVGASGVVRAWQDQRFEAMRTATVAPSFPLASLPSMVGPWRSRGGSDSGLDPRIARIAGSTDSLTRTYVDDRTGVTLEVLVLYGRGELLSQHTPEVCYPALGYLASDSPAFHQVPLNWAGGPVSPTPAPVFRALLYERRGKSLERQEVYCAFRQQGRWLPDVDGNWKTLSLEPGLYKVQVQRRVADQERRVLDVSNPTAEFLSLFIPAIERRIAQFRVAASSGS